MDDSEQEDIVVPLHHHYLQRRDAHEVYENCGGAWKCDHCLRTSSAIAQKRFPWHCVSGCEFDLCHECVKGREHPLHAHILIPADANLVYAGESGVWACENCNRNRLTTKERFPYHCAACKFDLCSRCANGIQLPVHEHRLLPADADIVYPKHSGMWFCDRCKSSRKQLEEKKMWHCSVCNFDICITCAKGVVHPHHVHPLYIADADVCYSSFNGQWVCDACHTPRRLSNQRYMRHCSECSYDLCFTCFKQLGNFPLRASTRDADHSVDSERTPITTVGIPESEEGASEFVPKRDKAPEVESGGDGALCVLCMDRPRNATFVHGNSGHLACCMQCATEVFKARQPCPICRQGIQCVIKQFLA